MAYAGGTITPIFTLPDELLEAIVEYVSPSATVAFGTTCRRSNKITFEPLVWRRHCVETWRYWRPQHELQEKLQCPPAQTKWQILYNERSRIDREVLDHFKELLLSQQLRIYRMEKIAAYGYDVKDLLLRMRDQIPESAEDVLARRYYANAILGQIHRATAIEKWSRLTNMKMVRMEEALGAFDLFVLGDGRGDLDDIDRKFDHLANAVQGRDPGWDELSTRTKAIRVVRYLRSEGLVGNPNLEDYSALMNNFIMLALLQEPHTSLPLQSGAIYCAVARRLGIDAKLSNYPGHVHVIIKGSRDQTLDGRPASSSSTGPETMHLDPWRNSEEMSIEDLKRRLSQMGAHPNQHDHHLAPASTMEITIRAAKNIMHSVQEARQHQQQSSSPDPEASWYSMLWAMIILGDSNNFNSLHRRKQCIPYLIDHFHSHFPEDLGFVEKHIPPLFAGEREHEAIVQVVEEARAADRTRKAPNPRNETTAHVAYKIGHHFVHRRYGYEGFIIGWNTNCSAEPRWIHQMRVDDLPRGREQPFYNVVADDKSVRYVAEENLAIRNKRPSSEVLMGLAGRYFKRWDEEMGRFVSNLGEEWPDD